MNRKRFVAEPYGSAGSRNKQVQPYRGAAISCGGDCAASRWDSTARVAHQRRDFLRTGKQGLSQKLTVECSHMGTSLRALSPGSLCRVSKERAEEGPAWRFRRGAW
jgi:hypothetical protein